MSLSNALLFGLLLAMVSFGVYEAGMAYHAADEIFKNSLGGH